MAGVEPQRWPAGSPPQSQSAALLPRAAEHLSPPRGSPSTCSPISGTARRNRDNAEAVVGRACWSEPASDPNSISQRNNRGEQFLVGVQRFVKGENCLGAGV